MTLADILTQPIPDQTAARELKKGYREYPLAEQGARDAEPLVDIAEYGIAGQSYYSRPNAATGDPVPGVSPVILVRKSVAERLAAINYALQTSEVIIQLFGRPVELYVEEGVRLPAMQKQLYEETFPELIRKQHPDFSQAEVLRLRDEMIARPPASLSSPSPHVTGAAVDLKLRYAHPNGTFVPKAGVEMGHGNADLSAAAHPDFFEHKPKLTAAEKLAQRNRRIFYWVMRGALLSDDSGFMVNPTEWWHWSYGDQMWAKLTQAPQAFFGAAANIS